MLAAALLLSLSLAQATTYVWTDQEGDHYTNDPSTIPKGVKVRTTEGVPVEVVKGRPQGLDDGEGAAPAPNRCKEARRALARAEARLAAEKATPAPPPRSAGCQEVLALKGQAAYAACMAGPAINDLEAERKARLQAAEAEVERARDELRKVTYGGCG